MALALLCSELKSLSPSKLPNEDWRTFRHLQACKFRAFVVDHGVRKGSHEEAQAVVEVLKGRGEICHWVLSSISNRNRHLS